MCTTACNFIIDGSKFDYFAHKFGLGLLKFLHTRLSVGGASLLENWILEGEEQGNFSVNAFVFICIVFGLNFLGAKL